MTKRSMVLAFLLAVTAALMLASVASAAAKSRGGSPIPKYPARNESPDENYVWANLTWDGDEGTIVWDGQVSPEAEGQATDGDAITDARLDVNSQQYVTTQERLVDMPASEVFTSKKTPKDLHLNGSRHIQLDLFVKKTEENTAPCDQSDPFLDAELLIGTKVIAAGLANQYVQKTSGFTIGVDGPDGAEPAGDWLACKFRMQPEIDVIQKDTVLTLRVVHVKQDAIYTFGFSGDHRSVLRFAQYSPEELLYRHPALFLGTEEVEAGTGDASLAFFVAGAALVAPLGARRRLVMVLVAASTPRSSRMTETS